MLGKVRGAQKCRHVPEIRALGDDQKCASRVLAIPFFVVFDCLGSGHQFCYHLHELIQVFLHSEPIWPLELSAHLCVGPLYPYLTAPAAKSEAQDLAQPLVS